MQEEEDTGWWSEPIVLRLDDDGDDNDDGDDGDGGDGDDDGDGDGDYNADLPARIAGHLHKLPILPLMKSMMKMTTVLMAARCNSQKK